MPTAEKKPVVTFKPKAEVKKLLGALSDRARDILVMRYGLGKTSKRETLEAIGNVYGITRERVRQIESFALGTIRRSEIFAESDHIFSELKELMDAYGTIVNEQEFLDYLNTDRSVQNHFHFLLVVGDYFERLRESDEFYHRWTTDPTLSTKVHASLKRLHSRFKEAELVSEEDIILRFLEELKKEIKGVKDKESARKWLSLSKVIGSNPLGEWGLAASPNVKARGIRDLAYLVLRNHGSPMHFTEVAKEIERRFGKKAHTATCHNELIKDDRFVLVGRGLYALSEWGYKQGVVRDIIRDILKASGPLHRNEIIEKVLRERHVRENTILVNLQNSKYFKKDEEGRYAPVS